MRVNIYAEEMSEDIEIIEKTTPDGTFTGLRIYLYLPVTKYVGTGGGLKEDVVQIQGPFMHYPNDNDSAAITFWGKSDLIPTLKKAIQKLEEHYAKSQSK